MMNFTLIRGEWRRGADRVSPNTVRALHARGVCRLWIPITPETADALGWGKRPTAREWHRFRFEGAVCNGVFTPPTYCVGGSGPLLNVPVTPYAEEVEEGGWWVTFRLYARIPLPKSYEVIGAAPRKGAPCGWCWEVAPRAGAPVLVMEQGGVEVARYEVAAQALHERIGKDLAAIDPAAWQKTPRG
jgi:hypothetical protein